MKTLMDRVADAKTRIKEISIEQFNSNAFSNYTVIDVREPKEHMDSRIPNSINIPMGGLEFEILKHCETNGVDTKIVLYCRSGGRSALAAETLLDLGFSNTVSLAGGINAWQSA
ncbi:MAG: rhodanese-related sulfurtransferase [Enterobacterales bacterium]|jgi:rhodanese-related sulfurtransferase